MRALLLIKEGSHLSCKTKDKCLDVRDHAKMVERDKDDPFPPAPLFKLL